MVSYVVWAVLLLRCCTCALTPMCSVAEFAGFARRRPTQATRTVFQLITHIALHTSSSLNSTYGTAAKGLEQQQGQLALAAALAWPWSRLSRELLRTSTSCAKRAASCCQNVACCSMSLRAYPYKNT